MLGTIRPSQCTRTGPVVVKGSHVGLLVQRRGEEPHCDTGHSIEVIQEIVRKYQRPAVVIEKADKAVVRELHRLVRLHDWRRRLEVGKPGPEPEPAGEPQRLR
jgi:hypothetical protein